MLLYAQNYDYGKELGVHLINKDLSLDPVPAVQIHMFYVINKDYPAILNMII